MSVSSTCQCCGTKGSSWSEEATGVCVLGWPQSGFIEGRYRKVTDEECKGTGRVILFLTSLWILEFLRNQRETKNHQLQNVPPFSGDCDSDCPPLSGED